MTRIRTAIFLPILLMGCATIDGDYARFSAETSPDKNPWTNLDFNDNPENFQFAVVTDRTGGERDGIFDTVPGKLNLMQPEFVMSVGDMIEGYTEDMRQVEKEWNEFNGMIDELEMPFFYTSGNHDISNPGMSAVWNRRYGRSYYHFVYRDVLFLIVNTQDLPNGPIGQEQVEYFKEVLAENRDVRWTLVFMHQPVWREKTDNGWMAIERELQDRRAYTVFAGHVHNYTRVERLGREYFTLATCGAGSKLGGPKVGQFDHIAWITMSDEGPRLANLMLDGIHGKDIREKANNPLVGALLHRGDSPMPVQPTGR